MSEDINDGQGEPQYETGEVVGYCDDTVPMAIEVTDIEATYQKSDFRADAKEFRRNAAELKIAFRRRNRSSILAIIIWFMIFSSWGIVDIAVAAKDGGSCDHVYPPGFLDMRTAMIVQGVYELIFGTIGIYVWLLIVVPIGDKSCKAKLLSWFEGTMILFLAVWIIITGIVLFGGNVKCIHSHPFAKLTLFSWIFSVLQFLTLVVKNS